MEQIERYKEDKLLKELQMLQEEKQMLTYQHKQEILKEQRRLDLPL